MPSEDASTLNSKCILPDFSKFVKLLVSWILQLQTGVEPKSGLTSFRICDI